MLSGGKSFFSIYMVQGTLPIRNVQDRLPREHPGGHIHIHKHIHKQAGGHGQV